MKVKIVQQGQKKEENFLREIKKLFQLSSINGMIFSTAYIREAAVQAFSSELTKHKQQIQFFIGIRNEVTSVQALNLLLKLGVQVFVVDTGSLTTIYHQKNYVAYNGNRAIVIIGSANFTPSGLVRNIENGTILDFDLKKNDDRLAFEGIKETYLKLSTEFTENIFELKNSKDIETLLLEGLIVDEEDTSYIREVGKNNNLVTKNIRPIMKHEISDFPIKKIRGKVKKTNTILTSEINKEVLEIEEVWCSKPLMRRDINLPSNPNSHATGSMLWKKGEYNIDQQNHFRMQIFNDLEWKNDEKNVGIEYAFANFVFIIDGINYGTIKLKMKHDGRTDTTTYEQRQPMTTLYWGDAKPLIANNALLGKKIRLYKISENNKKYLIEIS